MNYNTKISVTTTLNGQDTTAVTDSQQDSACSRESLIIYMVYQKNDTFIKIF